MAKTAEGIGASFSNLVGESLAEHYGYRTAFAVLSLCATFPIVVYAVFMPAAKVTSVGVIDDEIAVSLSVGAPGIRCRSNPDVVIAGDKGSRDTMHGLTHAARGVLSGTIGKGYRPVGAVNVEPDIGRRYVRNPLGTAMADDSGDNIRL